MKRTGRDVAPQGNGPEAPETVLAASRGAIVKLARVRDEIENTRGPAFRVAQTRAQKAPPPPARALEQLLSAGNFVRPADLLKAMAMEAREDCSLGEILRARGWVSETDLRHALEQLWGV